MIAVTSGSKAERMCCWLIEDSPPGYNQTNAYKQRRA
jgi:hypothetical protein